jgi:tetratricopeptide (TPR) repeat protein
MSISKVVDPTIVIPVTEKITFITDGIKFYLDNITNELRNEIKKQQINKMYKEAKDNYSKERYKSVLRITEDILAIDSENKPVRILNMLARTNMLYTNKKYDEAKNEVSKLLEIDPDNKEANILLLRIDNIMNMMPGR